MQIVFYKKAKGKSPIKDLIDKLKPKDRARILGCLKNIEELGFDCPRVQFRQIKGKLWEIKIRSINANYRIFYLSININIIVLLHCYKKQSQKTPIKEIEIVKKRILEVLANEQNYTR